MADLADKLAQFQAVTGLEDPDLCTEILSAHGWDLDQSISNFTTTTSENRFDGPSASTTVAPVVVDLERSRQFNATSHQEPERSGIVLRGGAPPGLVWKLITLPFSIVAGSLGLISGAIGLGMWAAGGVLSYSLSMIGLNSSRDSDSSSPLVSVSAAASEAMEFVAHFGRDYHGTTRPNFVSEGFMDALQRSQHAFKLMFVYLHSPDHPDTTLFCERTLCNEAVAAFVNENFVAWGASIHASEGFKMSNSLKASLFPFCAVVIGATNQRIALLQQVEGPTSPEEMMTILQRVHEESAPLLVPARLESEERRNNMHLREEQDAAFQVALEADQAREHQRKEEEELLAREAAEAIRKKKEEEEAREREAHETAKKEAALARMRQEKALSLGTEPEKGPDVTQVLVRFPSGERNGRRFHSTATVQSVYDYVDSLGCLEVESYSLVSNFPRVVYGPENHSFSLKEAGLHPQVSLFVERDS